VAWALAKTGEFRPGTVQAEAGYSTRFLAACNAFDRAAVAADTKKY